MALKGWLKQSTAVTVTLGPLVDATDGVTAETGLTLSQADIRLSKNDAAFAQKGEATSASHKENGYYSCNLNTTDTGTLGLLTVAVNESGAAPVRADYLVVSADAWDAFMATTKAELSAVPAANANVWAALKWLLLKSRNKVTQTNTTQTIFADDGTTPVSTSTVSADGTTSTRGEYA